MCTTDKQVTMVSLDEAADELSTTGLRLLMLIREGTLEGHEGEGGWHVTRQSLEHLKEGGGAAPVQQKGCASSCTASRCGCK